MPTVSAGSSVMPQCWNRYMSPKVTLDAAHLHLAAEVDVGCHQVVAGLHIQRDADDVGAGGVARRLPHQRIAQREVADRALGTGVDDGLRAHRAHHHVRDQQPAQIRSGTAVKADARVSPCERVMMS